MLIILYGITGGMGKFSREYFRRQGFSLISKLSYFSPEAAVVERYEPRNRASLEKVKACDFTYWHNGILVGLNKSQLLDAVHGKANGLLTISTDSIDFVRELKTAYGGYVTVVGAYIDDTTLRQHFLEMGKIKAMTERELESRLKTGQDIKRNLSRERSLFDELVIYGGEKSLFNYEALQEQYSAILQKARRREKELNDKHYIKLPYIGTENYVFISYAHDDKEQVYPVLKKLQQMTCRVWYDDGIQGGENWRRIVAGKLQEANCITVLWFHSCASSQSGPVAGELELAQCIHKKIIPILIDDTPLKGEEILMFPGANRLDIRADAFYEKLNDSIPASAFAAVPIGE